MRNKLIAAGIGLFGAGALWGWAITGDVLERKMKSNQRLLGDIITRKDMELIHLEGLLLGDPTVIATDDEEDSETEVDPESVVGTTVEGKTAYSDADVTEERAFPVGETLEETESNLQGLIDRYTNDPDNVQEFVSKAKIDVEHNDRPFVISQQTYAWDEEEGDEFEKQTLTWYPRERVLVDDDEDPIDNINDVIGMRSLASFGGESGDPDTVFVRNRRLRTDFEVVQDVENLPPLHVRYAMPKEEFETRRAAGQITFREDDV